MNRRNQLTSLAFLLAVSAVQAQETTGTIIGAVSTVKSAPIAGAVVRASSPSLLGVRTATTDANGNYRLALLPPGNYEVTITKDGFITSKATLRVNASSTANQPITLKGIQETGTVVEVISVAAAVDKTETTTKTSFSQDTLSEITGATGSIGYGALTLSPGVTGSVQYASVRGGSQQGTQYLVDGMSSRDNVTAQGRLGDFTLDDLVEDVAVLQSPLNARYGNTSTGIVSLVTKRGSNDWTGTFRAKLFKESWTAFTRAPRNRAGAFNGTSSPAGSDDLSRTYEFSITGPIIKDHLSFTYGTRLQPSDTSTAQAQDLNAAGLTNVWYNGALYPAEQFQSGQTQYGPNKTKYNQFNLFWQVNQDHSFEWSYTGASQTVSDIQGNLVTPDIAHSSNFQQSDKSFYSVAYKGVYGSNMVLEARYGKNRSDTQFLSGPGAPITLNAYDNTTTSYQDIWDLGNTYNSGGGTADNKPDQRATESATLNWSIALDAKGQHQIDIGYELQKPIWGTVSRGNSYPQQFRTLGMIASNYANPAFAGKYVMIPYNYFGDFATTGTYDPNLDGRAIVDVGVPKVNITNPTNSLYINDLWSINNNFSFMAGFRYDKMSLSDGKGKRFESSWVSPRFEGKWDINGDQKRIVNLSYGQFRGILNARYYRTMAEGRLNTQIIRYWTGAAMPGGPFPATPVLATYAQLTDLNNYTQKGGFASSDMYDIDKKYKPEVNSEVTLGYRRSFDNGANWRATMVYRSWKDLSMSVGDPTLITVANPVDPTEQFVTYKRTLMNDDQGKRQYKGLEFEWNMPFGSELTFAGSYVYSRLTGNNTYGDATTFGAFSGLAATGYFRNQQLAEGYTTNQFEPNGQLALSRNHIAKAWLTYRVLKGKTVSSITLQGSYTSGAHESLANTFSNPAPIVPGTTDSTRPLNTAVFFNGRGNYTAPDYWNANLQYNVEASLTGKVRVFSQLAITNVFNHQIPANMYRDGYSTTQPFASATVGAGRGYWSSTSATNSARYGTPSGYANMTGARGVTFDFGLKF